MTLSTRVFDVILVSTCIAIFIIPVTFYVVERMSGKGHAGETEASAKVTDKKEGDSHA